MSENGGLERVCFHQSFMHDKPQPSLILDGTVLSLLRVQLIMPLDL